MAPKKPKQTERPPIVNHDAAKNAIIRVGNARGFVVQSSQYRYVITAAHCLPCSTDQTYESDEPKRPDGLADRLLRVIDDPLAVLGRPAPQPPWSPFAWASVYHPCRRLLGPLGGKPVVSAHCLFWDAISDLAILGLPGRGYGDYQGNEEEDAYVALTNAVTPLRISDPLKSSHRVHDKYEVPVWLLSFTGELIQLTAEFDGLVRENGAQGGMGIGGGEIPLADGLPPTDPFYPPNPNAFRLSGSPLVVADGSAIGMWIGFRQGLLLTHNLPAWFLQEIGSHH